MKTYLINTDTNKSVGRFAGMKDAETVGNAAKYNFVIATDAEDFAKLFNNKELVEIYNNETGADITKFASKTIGIERLIKVLDEKQVVIPGQKKRTKMDMAMEIFAVGVEDSQPRKEILRRFQAEAGLTEKGAATYYQLCRKRVMQSA